MALNRRAGIARRSEGEGGCSRLLDTRMRIVPRTGGYLIPYELRYNAENNSLMNNIRMVAFSLVQQIFVFVSVMVYKIDEAHKRL